MSRAHPPSPSRPRPPRPRPISSPYGRATMGVDYQGQRRGATGYLYVGVLLC